jgi:hypothetical protein
MLGLLRLMLGDLGGPRCTAGPASFAREVGVGNTAQHATHAPASRSAQRLLAQPNAFISF